MLAGDPPIGRDEDQRRPGAHRVFAPQPELGVMDHGMDDAIAGDRRREIGRRALGGEFRRVDSDDDDLLGKGLLDPPQGGQDVHAVDAAEGPEIEDDELAAQRRQGERRVDVEPGEAGLVEIGGADDAGHGLLSSCERSLQGPDSIQKRMACRLWCAKNFMGFFRVCSIRYPNSRAVQAIRTGKFLGGDHF
jgi:hypothetical protein